MINYSVKKSQHFISKPEIANFYQRNFALAQINWEINRQEDRLKNPTVGSIKK